MPEISQTKTSNDWEKKRSFKGIRVLNLPVDNVNKKNDWVDQ